MLQSTVEIPSVVSPLETNYKIETIMKEEKVKENINYLEEISNYIFTCKYARYNEKLKRRETWEEAVDRVLQMHLKKYSFLGKEDKDKIIWAFDLVKQKRNVPSMRSLQFGGPAIEAHNARMFNCACRHIDSIRSFAETFYLLLCGCGVGIGLSRQFLNRLPDLVNEKDKTGSVITYTVQDTIEGWADSLEALLLCYFKNTAYTGRKIVFDYSKIRKKGEILKTGGGKAPGFRGLKNAHMKIKQLLDHIIEFKGQSRLKSINAYDIIMHSADAVLSGGIRRSATSTVFDKDDEDMLNAKTYFKVDRVFAFDEVGEETVGGFTSKIFEGKISFEGQKIEVKVKEFELEKLRNEKLINWSHLFPQRGRSNNSILLKRDEVSKVEFDAIVKRTREFGEPGFVFANDLRMNFNPCFEVSFVPITDDGVCGVQFCVAGNTKLITKNGIEEIKNCVDKKVQVWNGEKWSSCKPFKTQSNIDLYRVHFSDGSYLDATENHKFLVKKNYQKDFYEKTTMELINDKSKGKYAVPRMDIISDEQGINEEYAYEYGYFKGDGHIANKRRNPYANACLYGKDKDLPLRTRDVSSEMTNKNGIKYKEVHFDDLNIDLCKKLKEELPVEIFSWNKKSILNFIAGWLDADGTNASKGIRLYGKENGIRDCQLLLTKIGIRSSVNLMQKKGVKTNLCIRQNDVWYLQITKTNEIPSKRLKCNNPNNNKFKGKFQIIKKIEKLEGKHDSFCLEEKTLHQCLFNNVITKQCNLTSVNGRLIDTYEKFKESTEASAIIGTLQAGYTNFPYLSNASKLLTEEEALLGCSITGMMDNPKILLNEKYQKEMANLAKSTNVEWAKKINIKPAARCNVIKPEGTVSLVLGTGSGIHPHHARKYIRRVQNNKIDNVYKFFKKHNKHMCEESVWSANKTDDVISFPIEVSENAMIKKDLTAIEHLEIIKKTQKNWVIEGTNQDVNKKDITHNVSCTVQVGEKEWDEVIQYIYDNKKFFSAISLLPKSGDKLYQQAPMEEIVSDSDKEHWDKIIEGFVCVDYTKLSEEDDKTSLQQEVACAGGQCEVVFN